ncbi:MAG: hypothetical protein QQN45_08415, partial [Nitrosopumilus sp.]
APKHKIATPPTSKLILGVIYNLHNYIINIREENHRLDFMILKKRRIITQLPSLLEFIDPKQRSHDL